MKLRNVVISTMLIMVIFMSVASAAERVSLGFLYGVSDRTELVDRTNGSINQVAPTCLDLTSKGNLDITSDLTHEFVNQMHERGILVTPFLSNHWVRSKGRAAIKNKENLANEIVNTILEYNLDGINVDIENLTPEDKDGFSELVRLLSEKMPKDKILSVSVAANPEAKETGWQGSYDYAKLGEYSDYLFIMAYDEHSQGGACGPVASFEFVEKSIQHALKYVSRDKIVLGIPLYGRYWKEGEEVSGEAVVIGAVPSLISKNKGIVKYDENIGEACVTFSIDNPKIKSKINGITLEDGNYTIWYPNEESIKVKLKLVNQYNLLGVGVWALGQEKIEFWNYYKNELNQIPYVSEKEEKIREHYEALVVDVSRLEQERKIKLEYKDYSNVKEEQESEKSKVEGEKLVVLPNETLKTIKEIHFFDIKKNRFMKIDNDNKLITKENIKENKAMHIFRLCSKYNLR